MLPAAYRSGCRDKHNHQQCDSNLGPLIPQSDALTTRLLLCCYKVVEERLLTENLHFSSFDDEIQCPERVHDNCPTTSAIVVFLKQKLEQLSRSNLALEEHLREKSAREARLRETVGEFEKSDSVWQERVVCLETQRNALVRMIDDLQARLTDVEV